MSNVRRPRLLYLRFARSDLPLFIRLHLRDQAKCLSQFFDLTIIDHSCDYRRMCDTYHPDLALFESGIYVGERHVANVSAHPNVPKLGFIHCDAYCSTRQTAIIDMARWGITTFFAISVSMGSYSTAFAENLFVWPNFANPEIHHDYQLPKVIPILFTGSQAMHYPWRNRMHRILSQHYPTLQCPHFGWTGANAERAASRLMHGEQYARLINSTLIAPTCGTIANDVVRKHFEIPACNACLMTQRTPAVEAAGFRDLVNCIFVDDDNVIEKVDWLFNQPELLHRITQAGRELVESHHTIRNRDQLFQWYNLHQQLKPNERIVQLGPFQPLTIVEQGSNIRNAHLMTGGAQRLLLAQGDEKLWSGRYDEAEALYRRCLNYHDMPEPKLRLALCSLYTGDPAGAEAILREQFHRVMEGRAGAEPDPVEWAYYMVALLCRGRLGEATLRGEQFSRVRHEELDRVRTALRLLSGRTQGATSALGDNGHRSSVHQMPERTVETWLEGVVKMLSAARQNELATKLANSALKLKALHGVDTADQGVVGAASGFTGGVLGRNRRHVESAMTSLRAVDSLGILGLRASVRMWLRQNVKPSALRALWRLESLVGCFLPYKWSLMGVAEHSLTVQQLLRSENLVSGLLVGAAARAWLTEAFLAGMAQNATLPRAVCMNHATRRFDRLQRRLSGAARVQCRRIADGDHPLWDESEHFDVIAIDSSELRGTLKRQTMPNSHLIILDDVEGRFGHKMCRAVLADENYRLICHEPSQDGAYAIFRRVEKGSSPAHEPSGVTVHRIREDSSV